MMMKRNSFGVLLSTVSAFNVVASNFPAYAQQGGQVVGGYDASVACGAGFTCTLGLTNTSYGTGVVLGGLQTVPLFRTAQNPSGLPTGITVASQTGNVVPMTFYGFDALPSANTSCADHSAFSLGTADVGKLIFAPLTITPVVPQGSTASIGQASIPTPPPSIHNHDVPATVNIYTCLVANGLTTTGSTTDLVQKIGIAQD